MDNFSRDQLSKELLKDFEKKADFDLDSEPGIPVKILAPLILLAVVIFGVYAWQTDKFAISRDNSGQPPLVKAGKDPVRVRPDEPGGMYIANRDKKIYETISDKEGSDLPDVVQILPRHEEPVAREDIKEGRADIIPDFMDKVGAEPLGDLKPVKLDAIPEDKKVDAAKTDIAKNDPAKQAAVNKTEVANIDGKKVVAKEELLSTDMKVPNDDMDADLPKEQPEAKKNQEPITIKDIKDTTASQMRSKGVVAPKKLSSGVKIQLGSFRTEGDVQKTWGVIKKKYSSLLDGMELQSQKADLGDRGVFYRLRVGSLSNESDARKLCQKLIEQNQGCFVVKK